MLKQGGQWSEVDWTVALEYVASALLSEGRTRWLRDRCSRFAGQHARRNASTDKGNARARFGQYRFPLAAIRFFGGRFIGRRTMAWNEDRRRQQVEQRVDRWLIPQGSTAAVGATARGDQARLQSTCCTPSIPIC